MNVDQLIHHAPANEDSDVFIAGAGPAGLACAIAAAAQGLKVTIADGMKPPIDKACGEGLLPDALAALSALGITLYPADTDQSAPLRGIRFIGDSTPTGSVTTEAVFPSAPGRGIRRTRLHQLLLDRAAALGVRFHWQTVVQRIGSNIDSNINSNQVQTNRGTFHTRYIIGADGPQSRIRSLARLEKASTTSRRIGLRQHFAVAPWNDFVEIYWSNRSQAYVTPVSSSEICIAFVSTEKFSNIQQALSLFPALKLRLAYALPTDIPLGAITLTHRLRRVTSANIALIGDASGSVDAITGCGLALCFHQALALAEALKSNNMAQYQHAHRDIQRLPALISRGLLLMDSSPRFRALTLGAFNRHPNLFSHLLNIHIGHSPTTFFGLESLLLRDFTS